MRRAIPNLVQLRLVRRDGRTVWMLIVNAPGTLRLVTANTRFAHEVQQALRRGDYVEASRLIHDHKRDILDLRGCHDVEGNDAR